MTVIEFRRSYSAKLFKVRVGKEDIHIAGTLCGCIDLALPGMGTMVLSPDEAATLAAAILSSREDVLKNSRPLSDPMLFDGDRS